MKKFMQAQQYLQELVVKNFIVISKNPKQLKIKLIKTKRGLIADL